MIKIQQMNTRKPLYAGIRQLVIVYFVAANNLFS